MTKEEFIKQVYEDESQIPSGHLIVTGHEFMTKWKEHQAKCKDTKVIWLEMARLYDFEDVELR